jgi:hypothetical protein
MTNHLQAQQGKIQDDVHPFAYEHNELVLHKLPSKPTSNFETQRHYEFFAALALVSLPLLLRSSASKIALRRLQEF